MKKLILLSLSLVSLNLIACGKAADSNNGSAASVSSSGGSSENTVAMAAVQQKMLDVQNEQAAVQAQLAQLRGQGLSLGSLSGLNLGNFSNLAGSLQTDIQNLLNQFQTQLSQLDPNNPNLQGLIGQLTNGIGQLQGLQSQLSGIISTVQADVQNFFNQLNSYVATLPSPFNTMAANFLATAEQNILNALAKL